jgi:hypothetical protein
MPSTAATTLLHTHRVSFAIRNDVPGKLLNKALDNCHDALIRRFARASSTEELRTLCREASQAGAPSAAYWAKLTHPAAEAD